MIILTSNIVLSVASFVFGEEANLHLSHVALACFPLILFRIDQLKLIITVSLLTFSSFLVIHLYVFDFPPYISLTQEVMTVLSTICIAVAFFFTLIFSWSFVSDNIRSENKLQEAMSNISHQKEELTIQNKKLSNMMHELEVNAKEKLRLRLEKEKIETLSEMKMNFLSNMSHEIRTPMNAISGMVQLSLSEEKDLTEKVQERLKTIKFAADNLIVVINDILDISKIEAGKISLLKEKFSIEKQLESLIKILSLQAEKKNTELSFSISTQVPKYVIGDSTRLYQVLINLVGNSLKFTEEGSVDISVHLVNKEVSKTHILFEVRDTGIGIPEEDHDKIFESFSQRDSSFKINQEGTGLGLTISKRLVEIQNGTIRVSSKLGKGSCFSFILPFDKIEDNSLIKEKSYFTEEHDLSDLKILIAEDYKVNQVVLTQMLNKWKITPDIVDDGEQALNQSQKTKYDLILMDIKMPHLDGYQTTHAIKKDTNNPNQGTPIIALTADLFPDILNNMIRMGANNVLAKPIDHRKLLSTILEYTRTESTLFNH